MPIRWKIDKWYLRDGRENHKLYMRKSRPCILPIDYIKYRCILFFHKSIFVVCSDLHLSYHRIFIIAIIQSVIWEREKKKNILIINDFLVLSVLSCFASSYQSKDILWLFRRERKKSDWYRFYRYCFVGTDYFWWKYFFSPFFSRDRQ